MNHPTDNAPGLRRNHRPTPEADRQRCHPPNDQPRNLPPIPPCPTSLPYLPYRTTAISRPVSFSRRPPDPVHVTMSSIRTPNRPGR